MSCICVVAFADRCRPFSYRGCPVLQVGRQEPVMVLRVDKEKGYIDLSKRFVPWYFVIWLPGVDCQIPTDSVSMHRHDVGPVTWLLLIIACPVQLIWFALGRAKYVTSVFIRSTMYARKHLPANMRLPIMRVVEALSLTMRFRPRRRVSPEDVAKCEERYNKSKMVHSIMRHVAETTGADLEQLYKTVTWPLYRLYGHAFDAFKQMVVDDGAAVFARLEQHNGGPVQVLSIGVSDGPSSLLVVAAASLQCLRLPHRPNKRS